MADLNIKGSVDIATGPARRAMNVLAREIESYGKLTDKSTAAARSQRAGIKVLAETASQLTRNLREAEKAERAFAAAAEKAANVKAPTTRVQASTPINDAGITVSDRAMSQSAKYRTDEQMKLNRLKDQEAAANAKIVAQARAETEQTKQQGILIRANASIEEAASRVALNNARAQTEAVRQRVMLERAAAAAQRDVEQAQGARVGQLNAMRYALYDVARVAAVAAAALGAAFVAPIAVAVQWERQFANVQRTVFAGTNATQMQIDNLRSRFVDLARTIPTSWEQLTEVGALAGQLGIAQSMVTDFTKTVVQFSATTDVSADQAATAFGRLDNILLNNSGNFKGLASSILRVGVNSVATESSIIKITTQIASVAKQAGFSADEVIGLSGALASLGVPPELSRGVITRVFGEISRAIAGGGSRLEKFGNIANVSGKQFAEGWNTDAAGTFQAFLNGIKQDGAGAEASIRALGITSVRDVPILLRLANSGTVVADAFRDAAIGFKDASELGTQYAVIATTVDSKLKVLGNSFASLLDAMGQGSLGPLGALLDNLNKKLSDFADFASTDFGQWVVGISGAVIALGAILAVIIAIGARGVASFAALTVALTEMSVAAGAGNLTMGVMLAQLAATGPAGAKAAAALRLVGVAMKGLLVAGAVLAIATFLPDIMAEGVKLADQVRQIDRNLVPTLQRINTYAKEATPYVDDLTDGFKNMSQFSPSEAGRDLFTIQSILSELVAGGDLKGFAEQLRYVSQSMDISPGELVQKFPELRKELASAGVSFTATADGAIVLKNAVTGAATAVSNYTEEETEAQNATAQWIETLASADASFVNIGQIYDSMIEKQKDAAQKMADDSPEANDSWQNYFDQFDVGVQGYLDNLQQIIDSQTKWEENLFNLASRGASQAVIDELSRLGPEGAPLVQEFVDGTTDQILTLNDKMAQAGKEGSTLFATNLKAAVDTPGFFDAINALGTETATKIMNALADGTTSLPQIMEDYGLDLDVPVSLLPSIADQAAVTAQQQLDIIAQLRPAGYVPTLLEAEATTVQQALDKIDDARQADYSPATVEAARAAVQSALDALDDPRTPGYDPQIDQTTYNEVMRQLDELAWNRTMTVFASLQTSDPRGLLALPQSAPGSFAGGLVGETHGIPGYARGGYVGGARAPQKYQDTLLTRLRPAEFVVQEDAVDHYGKGFFNALNNRALDTSDFMRPVPVAARGGNSSGIQLVELVASDKALLMRDGTTPVVVTFAPSEAAAAANKGNTSSFKKGSN